MDQSAIEQIARLARLDLEDSAKARLADQLSAILEHFKSLEELDTEGVEPSVYAIDVTGRCRPDEPPDADLPQADRQQLMANTRFEQDRYYRVPRVIE